MGKTPFATLCAVWVASIVVQIGFGAYGVIVTKFAKKNNADPLVFCLFRDGFCFPVLFLAAYVAEKTVLLPTLRELPILMALGSIGMFGNQFLYLLGVYLTSADIASMFQPIAPVWACILVVVFRIEPLPNIKTKGGIAKVFGILCAVVGAIVTTNAKNSNSTKSDDDEKNKKLQVIGYICLLGNTLLISIYVVLQKKFIFNRPTSRYRKLPIGVTAWSYFFGFVTMAIASLYYVDQPEKFRSVNKDSIFPLIYAVYITSALCYMLITWANMHLSSSVVTAFWPLQVLFCVVLAYFVLGETLNTVEIIGGLLIIIALLAVVWSNYLEEKIKEVGACKVNDDTEPLTHAQQE